MTIIQLRGSAVSAGLSAAGTTGGHGAAYIEQTGASIALIGAFIEQMQLGRGLY